MRPPANPLAVTAAGENLDLSNGALIEIMRSVLAKGKPFRFQAPGNSMYPFIRDGDILTLTALTRRPSPGEVVAFIHPLNGMLLVHRVIHAGSRGCLMRGDGIEEACDGWTPPAGILGKVVRVERGGRDIRLGPGWQGRLIAFLSGRGWLMPLQASPLIRSLAKRILS